MSEAPRHRGQFRRAEGSWIGPGRLHLVPHVNAPVADFPVRKTIAAHHFLADLTLPYGHVLYDYNKDA
jgi:acetoacetate decarboxylase